MYPRVKPKFYSEFPELALEERHLSFGLEEMWCLIDAA